MGEGEAFLLGVFFILACFIYLSLLGYFMFKGSK